MNQDKTTKAQERLFLAIAVILAWVVGLFIQEFTGGSGGGLVMDDQIHSDPPSSLYEK